jgi:NAD(P)-dependent dehydrogenase (short-subunit alcohol dehydrogenase family)
VNKAQKVALITGVGRGLGREMALGLAANGYLILGCSRSAKSCSQAAEALGAPHEVQQVDVSDPDQVDAWARDLLARHPAPDLLINNAAVINRNAELWEVPVDEFQRTMRVNVEGAYYVIRSFVPAMIKAGRGVIVNFSSGWGRSTSPEVAPYCASKFAIEGLSRALSQELPSGLACVALNPGVIDTEMLRSCFGGDASAYPTPDNWAKAAVPFLLKLSAKDNGKSLSVPTY